MLLDTSIISFTYNRYSIYKSDNEYFLVNLDNDIFVADKEFSSQSLNEDINRYTQNYDRVCELYDVFEDENVASCHLIGEFRIDFQALDSLVGSFFGFDYFTKNEILDRLRLLVYWRRVTMQANILNPYVRTVTFYDVKSLKDIKPNTYQTHEYSFVGS